MRLGKGTWRTGEWRGILDHGVSDRRRDLVVRSIGKANVQNSSSIMACHLDGAVNGFKNVGLEQTALTEYADTGPVAVKKVTVLR